MSENPQLVHHYFQLAAAGDLDPYLAQFEPDAVAEDEGRDYCGLEAIRAWRSNVTPVKYAVQSVEPAGDELIALAEITGDFPGSPVTLSFQFAFSDAGRITRLAIRS